MSRVILVGGAPGVGKTTLGRALAAKIDATSLTADDIITAAQAVTTPESHPGLHVMRLRNSIDYFTTSSVEQLTTDATAQHDATWPAIEQVVRKHARWGPSIVIDGWSIRPERVSSLGLENVGSVWLVSDRAVFEERERQNVSFFGQSREPERMLENFLGRSLWYNDLIERHGQKLGLILLRQDGTRSVEALCDEALSRMERDAESTTG